MYNDVGGLVHTDFGNNIKLKIKALLIHLPPLSPSGSENCLSTLLVGVVTENILQIGEYMHMISGNAHLAMHKKFSCGLLWVNFGLL